MNEMSHKEKLDNLKKEVKLFHHMYPEKGFDLLLPLLDFNNSDSEEFAKIYYCLINFHERVFINKMPSDILFSDFERMHNLTKECICLLEPRFNIELLCSHELQGMSKDYLEYSLTHKSLYKQEFSKILGEL